jgi:hypothetical protein
MEFNERFFKSVSIVALVAALIAIIFSALLVSGVIKTSASEVICIERIYEGLPGEPGPAGEPGTCGPAGEIGLTGPAGEKGERGPIGPQGPTGEAGATGPRGIDGERGLRGLQGLQGEIGATGAKGDKGDPGVRGSYYGSFYDTTDQPIVAINTAQAMKLNSEVSKNGVRVVSNDRITIDNTGVYNIAFSAQIVDNSNSDAVVEIWLRKNNSDVIYTNTAFKLTKKGGQEILAWNFMEPANTGDYFQLMWVSSALNVVIYASDSQTTPYPAPGIPSLILTVEQVS